jgi:agmatinase
MALAERGLEEGSPITPKEPLGPTEPEATADD